MTVTSFAELQAHVDDAVGPTALLVRAAGPLASGGRTLVVSKPDIVITAAAAYDPEGSALAGAAIPVACGVAKTLVAIT